MEIPLSDDQKYQDLEYSLPITHNNLFNNEYGEEETNQESEEDCICG